MIDGAMIGLAHALAMLTYVLGCMIQVLPIPWKGLRAHGPQLMMDGLVAELATVSITLVPVIVEWITGILDTAFDGQFSSQPTAITLIITQLTALDASLFLLISTLSTTVVLAPVAYALSSMLGPLLMATTVALIVWIIVQVVIGLLPSIWLTMYFSGIVLFAIPFRIGRSLGSTLMATSIVFAVMLPVMPAIAIWLEGKLGYEGAIKPVEDIIDKSKSNPVEFLKLIPQFPVSIASLMAAVMLSLVAFPFAYFLIVSRVARSLASLLGSNSVGPSASSFILTPAWEMGGSVRK
jgi:hypothetical protein